MKINITASNLYSYNNSLSHPSFDGNINKYTYSVNYKVKIYNN